MQRSAAACDVSMVTSAHNKLVAVTVPLALNYSTGTQQIVYSRNLTCWMFPGV